MVDFAAIVSNANTLFVILVNRNIGGSQFLQTRFSLHLYRPFTKITISSF